MPTEKSPWTATCGAPAGALLSKRCFAAWEKRSCHIRVAIYDLDCGDFLAEEIPWDLLILQPALCGQLRAAVWYKATTVDGVLASRRPKRGGLAITASDLITPAVLGMGFPAVSTIE